MYLRSLQASTLFVFFYILDKHVCAVNTKEGGLWSTGNEEQNTRQWVDVIKTKRSLTSTKEQQYATGRVDNGIQKDDNGIVTRINRLENSIDELSLKTTNDVIHKISANIQSALVAIHDKLDSKLNHIIDQLNYRFEILENKLNTLGTFEESSVSGSKGLHRRDMNSGTLDLKIRNIERATSLLAVSKIKLVDLPYERECESDIEGDVESHLDACIQSRVTKLYNDYNEVLDFHVMLVDGTGPHEGRVEIIYRGRHGTICDYNWDYRDAAVVCRMLGYGYGGHAFRGSEFGNGLGETFLDNMACTGDERSLLACKHRGIKGYDNVGPNCHHGRDASVRCHTS